MGKHKVRAEIKLTRSEPPEALQADLDALCRDIGVMQNRNEKLIAEAKEKLCRAD